MEHETEEAGHAPGLKWRRRADGTRIPYWVAKPAAVKAGFTVKTQNLGSLEPDKIAEACRRLEREMLDFIGNTETPIYNGTLGSLLKLYLTHEDSSYRRLKPSSAYPYDFYAGKITAEHGNAKVGAITGLDVIEWHKKWRAPKKAGGKQRLGAATMALNVLKAALVFGQICNKTHCAPLLDTLSKLRLPTVKPRTEAPDAADIDRARRAAHDLGYHRAALCYALQFETTTRQWDLIGQWVEMSDPRPSTILLRGRKWLGPTFANIDANMVLAPTPSKTADTTGKSVHVNLSLCQMVMEELALIPEADRAGPLIVNPNTGRPFTSQQFTKLWQTVRKKAELSPTLWNRDIRAGGTTEAEMAGASVEDRAKLSAHSKKVNQRVYSRDVLVSSNRVVEARARFRKAQNAS